MVDEGSEGLGKRAQSVECFNGRFVHIILVRLWKRIEQVHNYVHIRG